MIWKLTPSSTVFYSKIVMYIFTFIVFIFPWHPLFSETLIQSTSLIPPLWYFQPERVRESKKQKQALYNAIPMGETLSVKPVRKDPVGMWSSMLSPPVQFFSLCHQQLQELHAVVADSPKKISAEKLCHFRLLF